MSSNDLRKAAPDDFDADAGRPQLKRWVVKRSAACAIFVFIVMVILTTGPFPLGPDYLRSALVAAVGAAIAGVTLAGRAYLHLQRTLAERAGSTLWYWLGRRVRENTLNKMSR